MAFDAGKIPEDLIENFRSKKGVFFVGAGLSSGVGFPTWTGLLKEMIAEADRLSWVSKDKIAGYKKLVDDNSNFLFLAEDLKAELGTKFEDFMTKRFVEHDKAPSPNHLAIVSINSSLIITINYDDLIEQAYNSVYRKYPPKFIYSDSKQAANNFWKGRFFILKAHGDANNDVGSLILTQRDYRKVLYREPGYRSLLQAIFTTKSILFLGVSMNDPEFNQLLDFLHDSFHGGGPRHYLFIDEQHNHQPMAKRYLEDFNIETIAYNNDKKDYAEVTEFLTQLQIEAPNV